MRNRSLNGFLPRSGGRLCFALLFQPLLDLGIGEQGQELVDLCRRRFLRLRCRRFPGRRRRSECAGERPDRKNERAEATRRDVPRRTRDRTALMHVLASRGRLTRPNGNIYVHGMLPAWAE